MLAKRRPFKLGRPATGRRDSPGHLPLLSCPRRKEPHDVGRHFSNQAACAVPVAEDVGPSGLETRPWPSLASQRARGRARPRHPADKKTERQSARGCSGASALPLSPQTPPSHGLVRLGTGSRLRHTLKCGGRCGACCLQPRRKTTISRQISNFRGWLHNSTGGGTVREVAAAVVLAHAGETAAF